MVEVAVVTGDGWADMWSALPESERDKFRRIAVKYSGLIPGMPADGSVPDRPTWEAVIAWQDLEVEILSAHSEWLERTKARYEANGWPWTTHELMRRSRLRGHE